MSKRPGQVTVTVETGYCPFCQRVRNLRHEERHMGALARTTITCESCHRTLSSTMGVATEEPVTAKPEPAVEPAPVEAETPASEPVATTKPAVAKGKASPAKSKSEAPRSRARRSK